MREARHVISRTVKPACSYNPVLMSLIVESLACDRPQEVFNDVFFTRVEREARTPSSGKSAARDLA